MASSFWHDAFIELDRGSSQKGGVQNHDRQIDAAYRELNEDLRLLYAQVVTGEPRRGPTLRSNWPEGLDMKLSRSFRRHEPTLCLLEFRATDEAIDVSRHVEAEFRAHNGFPKKAAVKRCRARKRPNLDAPLNHFDLLD